MTLNQIQQPDTVPALRNSNFWQMAHKTVNLAGTHRGAANMSAYLPPCRPQEVSYNLLRKKTFVYICHRRPDV